ncbi:helix-turn-helix transcriptional regulator [Terrihabitans rhizophilus]|uniref:Helix-turn-helix transcriptional regulator n=1 Tax=Terrihabitans rhizophilus TaxID=3092662 RepID=A0ABU4RND0_9HYPH|nr:helix-turn-helix transcriptional regulator [Terrihabitans sp. PJ23]MDX6806332.1 helix-turn-helix transcriptional regulator [Terrihabitans sp. PJ23]
MAPEQFKAWRAHMKLSQAKAADALGISKGSIEHYEAGKTRDGRPAPVPKTVALACAALALGITSYEGPTA